MSKKGFSFTDKSTWTKDYEHYFAEIQHTLAGALVIHFPNYNYCFVLRTDASLLGCGGLLVQHKPLSDGLFQEIVIDIVSHKFSEQASRWATYEQEAYAIFFCIKKMCYHIYCKPFIVETDHNNLRWMDTSLARRTTSQTGSLACMLPRRLESLTALAVSSSDLMVVFIQAHDNYMGHPGA